MGNETFPSSSSTSNFDAEDIMGRVMLIAIVILFVAVMFVLLLHLYARRFRWRVEQQLQLQLHHHQHQSPASGSTTTFHRQRRRFVFAQAQDPSRTAGLDPSILGSIPIVVFKSQDFEDGLDCAVCLSELEDGEKARVLPSCKHGFHVDCIDMWFRSHSTCPVCRNKVGKVGGTSEHEDVVNDGSLSQDRNFGSGNMNDHHNSSQNLNLNHGFSTEPPNFPAYVLVWGDQNQVNSTGIADIEDSNNASSSGNNATSTPSNIDTNNINRTQDETALAIDIPATATENLSSTRFVEEDAKSPVFTRLRSLKRLLSRERRGVVTSCSSSSSNNV